MLIFISKWHKHDNISIGDICERCGNIFDMFDKMWFDCSTSYKMRCYCVTCAVYRGIIVQHVQKNTSLTVAYVTFGIIPCLI